MDPPNDPVTFLPARSTGKQLLGHAWESFLEFIEALRPAKKFPKDEKGAAVTNKVECSRYWA